MSNTRLYWRSTAFSQGAFVSTTFAHRVLSTLLLLNSRGKRTTPLYILLVCVFVLSVHSESDNDDPSPLEGSSKMDQQDNDPSPLEGSSNTGQQDNDPSPLEGSSNTGQQDNDPEGSSNTGQQDNDPEGSSNTGQQDNDPSPLEGSSNTDQRGIKRGLCVQCGRKYWNDEILCSQPCRLQYWKKCRVDVYHDKRRIIGGGGGGGEGWSIWVGGLGGEGEGEG